MNHKIAILLSLIFGAAMPYAFSPYDLKLLALLGFAGWLYLLLQYPAHSRSGHPGMDKIF